jgi:hypothetical protein
MCSALHRCANTGAKYATGPPARHSCHGGSTFSREACRLSRTREETRTQAHTENAEDLAAVITTALAAAPIEIASLRRGVWTYVTEEHDAGTSPGRVILALTELIDASVRTSTMEREAITKRVILWCVEAYFGQLGGQGESKKTNTHDVPTSHEDPG